MIGRQQLRVVRAQAEGGHVARAPGVGQLGQTLAQLLEPGALDEQRRQIGLGKVAIVVRLFLGPLGDRDAALLDPAARLLADALASVERLGLSSDLELERAKHRAERVQVLHFDLRPQLLLSDAAAGRR